MKKLIICAALLVCLSNVAYANTQVLTDRLERLEQDIVLLQRKVYQGSESGSVAASTSNLDELYNRIASQETTIRELTNKIEKLEFEQKQLNDRLNKMNADIDVRFNMMQNAAPAAITPPAAGNDTAAYDTAYSLLKKGDYAGAENGFLNFMRDYPKSKLIGNANYWLGETYYARGQYEQAVGVFADGFTKYKSSPKAPDNLLKLGLTMNKLGKKAEACTAFKELPTEFPKAENALKERAKAESQKLSCK